MLFQSTKRPPMRSVCVAVSRCGVKSFRLKFQAPNRNDGAKHGQAGNRPTRHVNRTVGFRRVHHRVMPVGHISLLKRFPAKPAPDLIREPAPDLIREPAPDLIRGWRPVRVKKTRQIKIWSPLLDSTETEKAPEIASGRYVCASGRKGQIR